MNEILHVVLITDQACRNKMKLLITKAMLIIVSAAAQSNETEYVE